MENKKCDCELETKAKDAEIKDEEFVVTVDFTRKFYEDHENLEAEVYELIEAAENEIENEVLYEGDINLGFEYEGNSSYDLISEPTSMAVSKKAKRLIAEHFGDWASVRILKRPF